jgi:hypothetical protein
VQRAKKKLGGAGVLARDDDNRAEITNRSKAQTSEVTASLMHKDNQIIWCRVLRRRVGVYTGRA